MSYEVFYNDLPLHKYFKILNVYREVLPDRNNFSEVVAGVNGSYYLGYRYAEKKIKLQLLSKAKTKEEHIFKMQRLAKQINLSLPAKLIISDEVDKYYHAIIEGSTTINKSRHNAIIDLNFICYDPYAYSILSKRFEADEKRIVSIENEGSAGAYPNLNIEFTAPACFLQVTNPQGKTVLIGSSPDVDRPTQAESDVILHDDCTTTSNWTVSGNVLDPDRLIGGAATIGLNGSAIIASDYGTNPNGWSGIALRRNIGQNVDQFEVLAKVKFNSTGKTNDPVVNPDTGAKDFGTYTVTPDAGLRVRQSPNTTSTILAAMPKNTNVKPLDISNGWAKLTYNGVTGYSSMDYLKKISSSTRATTVKKYVEILATNLNVRKGASTSYASIGTVTAPQRLEYISTASTGWYQVKYNGLTEAYVSNKSSYSKIVEVTTNTPDPADPSVEYAENQIGLLEILGMSNNNQRLFRFHIRDNQEFFVYNHPEIYIGSSLVLQESAKIPAPQKQTVTEGTESKSVEVASGKIGNFNNFEGYFKIQRVLENGKYIWTAKISKMENGKVVKSIEVPNSLTNTNYSTEQLNNIVLYIAKYKDKTAVKENGLIDLQVRNLNNMKLEGINRQIFKAGDHLEIDFAANKIYLNGDEFNQYLDIGSEFFELPTGYSEFILNSDDKNISIMGSFQERYL